ncbi:hypothetical protein JAAARDRAFT_31034 [Jaapia argillacea MUCL 33604]|uniref:Uncharacterized protein n=1 Tax=Jaapia argillacea MUCL 33604 TaxID=933084 RepID=A0A067Q3D8_9AGAM|nr:hypothetical protein JAAARDRAFT_31034 [Jaapia argillacea MUCL 33604]
MMNQGSFAVAIVQRKVMIVQATRTHGPQDRWLDVNTYIPFGERIFLPSNVPQARISSSDILTIFPSSDVFDMPAAGEMLEVPPKAFAEFIELSSRNQKRYENLWKAYKVDTSKPRWWKVSVIA